MWALCLSWVALLFAQWSVSEADPWINIKPKPCHWHWAFIRKNACRIAVVGRSEEQICAPRVVQPFTNARLVDNADQHQWKKYDLGIGQPRLSLDILALSRHSKVARDHLTREKNLPFVGSAATTCDFSLAKVVQCRPNVGVLRSVQDSVDFDGHAGGWRLAAVLQIKSSQREHHLIFFIGQITSDVRSYRNPRSQVCGERLAIEAVRFNGGIGGFGRLSDRTLGGIQGPPYEKQAAGTQQYSRESQAEANQSKFSLTFRSLCIAERNDAILFASGVLTVCLVFAGVWLIGAWGYRLLGAMALSLSLLCFAAGAYTAWRWPECYYGAEPQRYQDAGSYSSDNRNV